MSGRLRLNDDGGGIYFAAPKDLQFIHTGSTVLDMVLGGGWPLGRIVNIVGDQSSGKTLLAIEAMANCALKFPNARIRYREPEAAFLPHYAELLGFPIDRVEFTRNEEDGSEADTVGRFYKDLDAFEKKLDGEFGLYILDSLDALSDEAELGREFGEGTYGANKAKDMSQMFRRITGRIESSKICLIVISQTRDRIGVSFGRRYSRSGGRALDFYASIVLYLAHTGEITRTVRGVKRPIGVSVKAKCTKNKISLPFRSCTFPIIFSFGVEDITAGLDWLHEHKMLDEIGLTQKDYKTLRNRALYVKLDRDEQVQWRTDVTKAVRRAWRKVETSFLPQHRKYSVKE